MPKRLTLLLLAMLISFAAPVQGAEQCPGDYPSKMWTDCIGFEVLENGDKYIGGYKDGKLHGHGTYKFTNGATYVGDFRANMRTGQGIFSFADGRVLRGRFENDKFVGNQHRRMKNRRHASYPNK